jgi:hypothetical protein
MSPRLLLPLILLALAAAPDASAQFQWRDANGRMVYSDMPPPMSVEPGSVIRGAARPAPAGRPAGAADTSAAAGADAAQPAVPDRAAPTATAPPSAADRELEFRKRRMERADAERKAAAAAQQAQLRASVCEDARSSVNALESGMRLSRVNAQGEREVVEESQRAGRLEAARRTVKDTCGT